MDSKGKHGFRSWAKSVAAKLKRKDGHNDLGPQAVDLKEPSGRGSGHGNGVDANDVGGLHTCQQLGAIDDSNDSEAIGLDRGVLALRPPEQHDPDRSAILHVLANNLGRRYEQLGAMNDLHETIGLRRDALALLPPGHPNRSNSLTDLANSLYCRYKQLGSMDDLQEAIGLHRDVLALLPQEHPDRSKSLTDLANSLYYRYKQLGVTDDLQEAISLHRDALVLCPPEHPDGSDSLINLAIVLGERYKQLGEIENLNEAIDLRRQALALRRTGDPDRSKPLMNLVIALEDRYKRLGEIEDLSEAIGYGEEVLGLCLLGHPERSTTLHIIANNLSRRHEQLGDIQDLNQAIGFGEEALELCPQGDSGHSTYLYNLANDLSRRCEQLGDMEDLNRAIGLGQEALILRTPGHHKYRSMSLYSLANDFRRRYHQLGDVEDLSNAIDLGREALALGPPRHPDRSRFLNSLANDLSRRYDQLGDIQDLNESIGLDREALTLCPPEHPNRSELMNNLGIGLKTRYDKLEDMQDLNEAISIDRGALARCPPGHPDRLSSLNNLAYHLGTRYKKLEAMDDLNEMIYLFRGALDLCPPGHSDRALSLNNLAYHLSTRHKMLEAVDDLNEAIALGRDVLMLSPSGSSKQSLSSESLRHFFSSDSSTVTESCDVLRALQEVRSGDWSSAYVDAKKSIDVRPSTMGYIAMALAHAGIGKLEEAMESFDSAQQSCNPHDSNLLLLIKDIIMFIASKHDEAIAHVHDLMDVSKDDETTYCYIQVLGKMYMMREDYGRALESLKQGQDLASSCTGRDLETISLIFGWSFDGVWTTARQCHCEALLRSGCAQEATQMLREILETVGSLEQMPDWVTGLRKKCVEALETLGDELVVSEGYIDAIERYSSALSLCPPNQMDILLKRSKAQVAQGFWEDSLADADQAIKLDPSSHRGFEMKYVALYGAKRYSEAIDAISVMLSLVEHSQDETSREEIPKNYISPEDAITAIGSAVGSVFKLCPLVLIDLTTGRLCDSEERVRIFKSDIAFKKLVSEAVSKETKPVHVLQAVATYFQWVMFSHTWEGKEPTFKNVTSVESIWNLDQTPLNDKLRRLCMTARDNGHRWVWSDTCCIDKETSAILSQSLTSMYSWYAEAAETLVYLSDIPPGSECGSLSRSRWMTRAWALQELLASRVVRFYDNTWKPYLNDMSTNHKESPAIKGELAGAMGVAPETITRFQPEVLGVREKLRLASERNATVEEDIAYSLIGIFSSDIIPRYGLGKTALGQLLESIVARSGDVTLIAWTGESLAYNSALPSSLGVYAQIPYSPQPMELDELDTEVERLRTRIPEQDALSLYLRVMQLPRATFFNRCLSLPCITFPVSKIGVQELCGSQGNLYHASVSRLGKVMFRTADLMPLAVPQKLVLVHPWLHDLRDPIDRFVSYDELEAESYVGTDDETDVESDWDAGDGSRDHHEPARASALYAKRVARPDRHTLALRLIARLGRPFGALLLEQQTNGQYKRVAAEREIVVPGVSLKTNLNHVRTKVLEIV